MAIDDSYTIVPHKLKKDKEMYILLNVLHCHKCGHAKYSE